MKRLKEFFDRHQWPRNIDHQNLSFEKIESAIEISLPEDYKYFLQKYLGHGAFIGQRYVNLWRYEEVLAKNISYEITTELDQVLGIGDNGSGELIGIEKRSEESERIILTPFIGLHSSNHIWIGNSFTDFLIRLDASKEWYT